MNIFITSKNIHLQNLVPFSWLVLEMCKNLCFICMKPLLSRRGRGGQLLWTHLLPLKTSTCQIRFHLRGLFLSCAEIYVSFVWDPSLPEEGGSQTIIGTFIGTKNPYIQIFTLIGSVVFEPIWIRQTDR